MVDLSKLAVQLYRRYGSDTSIKEQGIGMVLCGNRAAAIAEAAVCDTAVLGGDPDIDQGWHREVEHAASNVFELPLSWVNAEGPRGAVASAMGLALSGRRATAFLTGQDVASIQDLMHACSGKHLPLIVHLTNKAIAAHGIPLGSGHEGFHLCSESGWFTLFASNVQEVLDYSLIARKVAEECLVPGLVVMDSDHTAQSLQDVFVPLSDQIRKFLGAHGANQPSPTPAQQILFGETRSSVPRWHNLDRPILQGAIYDHDSFALGAAGRSLFFDAALAESLTSSFERFAKLTGRHYGPIRHHGDSELVFVVQGAAVETVVTVTDHLRSDKKLHAGVLAITSLRPFPGEQIAQALKGCRDVVVLERHQVPLGTDPPLLTEIRSALERASVTEKTRARRMLPHALPAFHSVVYGLGGLPLRAADVAAIPARLEKEAPAPFFMGLDFDSRVDRYPKRRILLDRLERAYPDIATHGLRDSSGPLNNDPGNTISIAVLRHEGAGHAELGRELGELLYAAGECRLRVRHSSSREWGGLICDLLVYSPSVLVEPGDGAYIDMLVLLPGTDGSLPRVYHGLASRLRSSGTVIAAGDAPALPQTMKAVQVHATEGQQDVLGTIMAVLLDRKLVPFNERKLLAARAGLSRGDDSAFQAGLRGATTVQAHFYDPSAVQWDERTPYAVTHLGRDDDQYDSLPRFWDQVGVPYQSGDIGSLTADPYFAVGAVAPLTASFRDLATQRHQIPVFDADLCTGCGRCWAACPEGALAPLALSPAGLIDAGISLTGVDAVRQISGQLATRITTMARKGTIPSTLGSLIEEAYGWLKDKLTANEERQALIERDLAAVQQTLGGLAVSVTDPFFKGGEQVKKDGGELLSIAVNSDACKGCGICEVLCEADAVLLVEQSEPLIAAARDSWDLFSRLPDTPSHTIERLLSGGDVSNVAALELSRYCLLSMSGGDGAEPGSGEKLALRMILAAAEFHQQPINARFARELDEAANAISLQIQEKLAEAMPGDDLEQLQRGLEQIHVVNVDLATLARQVAGKTVDAVALGRLIETVAELRDTHWQLTRGGQNLGRSRYGLAVAPGSIAGWIGRYPYNAFESPVLIDATGDTAQIGAGLLEGHLRNTCETVAVLRRAQLDIAQTAGREFKQASLTQLGWLDLTPEERALCPPLFVLGNESLLNGAAFSQVVWLLGTELPVKIIVVSEAEVGGRNYSPVLQAMAGQRAFVAQTSIACENHLQDGVARALAYAGPALIHVHGPVPARHGFPKDRAVAQASAAVASRAFPLFVYDPTVDGVHGLRLSLAGNPDAAETWSTAEGETVTVADWALTEQRYDKHFLAVGELAAQHVNLSEYLLADENGRRGKVPVVRQSLGDQERAYEISDDMITMVERCRDNWLTLQELAGIVTPFTDAVEARIRETVQAEHCAAIAALRSEYEEKISKLSADVKAEMAGRLQNQLMSMVRSRLTQPKRTGNDS